MSYTVKEVFYTLQGEGAQAGRPAVFCRFTGCNLWSGLERDRAGAACSFCDTDFVGTNGTGGGRYRTARELAAAVAGHWPSHHGPLVQPFVVCTGGEPLLQLDEELIAAFHAHDMQIAVETNGTRPAPPGIDWLCVSPKGTTELALRSGDEIKLVYPQQGAEPERFSEFEFDHHLLQPLASAELERNTALAVKYCLEHPQWRLSLQIHKLLGLR